DAEGYLVLSRDRRVSKASLMSTRFVASWGASTLVPRSEADLIPVFRTSPSMISDEGKRKKDVEEQAYGSRDDRGAEATGSRAQSRRCGARSRSVEAYDLRLEGEVRRDGCEPGAGSETVAR